MSALLVRRLSSLGKLDGPDPGVRMSWLERLILITISSGLHVQVLHNWLQALHDKQHTAFSPLARPDKRRLDRPMQRMVLLYSVPWPLLVLIVAVWQGIGSLQL